MLNSILVHSVNSYRVIVYLWSHLDRLTDACGWFRIPPSAVAVDVSSALECVPLVAGEGQEGAVVPQGHSQPPAAEHWSAPRSCQHVQVNRVFLAYQHTMCTRHHCHLYLSAFFVLTMTLQGIMVISEKFELFYINEQFA